MTPPTQPRMTPDEIEAYRASVMALIGQCLERMRQYPVGRDADPAPERSRR